MIILLLSQKILIIPISWNNLIAALISTYFLLLNQFIIMILMTIEHILHAKYCSKSFIYIHSFTPHGITTKWVLFSFPVLKLRAESSSNLYNATVNE